MKDDSRLVMYHSWRHLTFLHWPVVVEDLQRMLPPGLRVDTYEGVAYVGLVPFTMHSIRIAGLPAIPGLSASHETNVRTYVVDENGVPGVWFFSLDAENPVFVQTARAWYRLNYVRARMSVSAGEERIEYSSRRRVGGRCIVKAAFGGDARHADPGTLDHFLVERYALYAYSRGRLLRGRVRHGPYPLVRATCERVDDQLVAAAGLSTSDAEPHVLYSPGVDVEVFGIRRI
jgi:uncharacterized protein YqjF (DUF2071 family)